MNKSVLVVVTMGLLASSAANAGPLSNVRIVGGLAAGQALPKLPGIDLPPIGGGGAGGGPAGGNWLKYDTQVYPGVVQAWAKKTTQGAQDRLPGFVAGLPGKISDTVDPCHGNPDCSGGIDLNNIPYTVEGTLGGVLDIGNNALGLVKGGGPVPLPKFPDPGAILPGF